MMRIIFVLFAFLTTGCGKSACDELADCLDTEAPDDADEDACQEALDAGACD